MSFEIKQKRERIFLAIQRELANASKKHPKWPIDIIHASAIVSEESGELTRAALHFSYENGTIEDAKKEAVQTAVTAIRFLEGLEHYQIIRNHK